MNVKVHLPTTKEGWKMLNERIAEVQSEFIINEINNLPCSYERKIEILEGVKKKIEEEMQWINL
ncbi:hypothetical protein EDD65_102242 [Keratinibaculum paraultunense]|uniref:Uncharacterized protein n=1 Tax=Keratinibaculum paraultunense TaxID=1278232 RepID=A0A4R3KYN9_9FIRM|nr:hypothetical protein [Keratinibaculum paraultunense]QQY80579.1 hypothetical protein JL105_04570 [Keratinibaculum paraultunense]TCS91308.1 hypothetical protein EDD65_102242 [Keratinibaculum paraultunense]